MKGVVNGTQKILSLGKFWSDLKILETIVMSQQVSFFGFLCVSESQIFGRKVSESCIFFSISAKGLGQNVLLYQEHLSYVTRFDICLIKSQARFCLHRVLGSDFLKLLKSRSRIFKHG